MKRLILLAIAFCMAEFSFSQSDYRKGFIITAERDTIAGLINYRERAQAYKSCDFKKSESQNATTYEPNTIAGYGFDGDKFFESREIRIEDQLPKIVFLQLIVKGLVSLYKSEDSYFIEKGNNGLQQLTNKAKDISVDGTRFSKTTNQYLGTISTILFDCLETRVKVQKVKLAEKDLTNLIEEYNKCKGVLSVTLKTKKPWTKGTIGMSGATNISKINFKNTTDFKYLNGVFENSISPMVGISFDVLFPRVSERISFHSDIFYLSTNYYSYNVIESKFFIERNYVTIELKQIKIPLGIRYTFPNKKFTPYFNIGVSNTIHLNSDSKWILEFEFNSLVNTVNREAIQIKNSQLGLWGGFGASTSINNKLNAFFELRLDQTNGIAPFTGDSQQLSSKILNFQIICGIRTK